MAKVRASLIANCLASAASLNLAGISLQSSKSTKNWRLNRQLLPAINKKDLRSNLLTIKVKLLQPI